MIHVCLLKVQGKVYLMMDDENPQKIMGFQDPEYGLRYFEDAYAEGHMRGHVSSMSACFFHIEFQPRIVSFRSLETLRKAVDVPVGIYQLRGESGFMSGVPVNKRGRDAWRRGKVPNLTAGLPQSRADGKRGR